MTIINELEIRPDGFVQTIDQVLRASGPLDALDGHLECLTDEGRADLRTIDLRPTKQKKSAE